MNIKNNTGLIIYTAAPQDLSPLIKSELFCVDVMDAVADLEDEE
ncbi:hypothetical protein [Escherichia fergusonii]|nr:hypothetical protein [Escherichia fergusonii]